MLLVQRVSKRYPLYNRPADRLWEALPLVGRKRHTDFWALRDVTLEVPPGEFLAIIGPNGSGKSTLLQIAAGILQPTVGRVVAKGRIAALLELGAGFNSDFTGRENVFLNGEIMGLSRGEMERAFPLVAAFADIGDFIHRPVREYSSGMYVRLAFSTAIHVDPAVLIVDEALSVGDAVFGARCVRKFEELRERGVTVLFVSHDLGLVKRLADRAVLMLHGRVHRVGAPSDVVNEYTALVHEWQSRLEPAGVAVSAGHRHGDGTSRIARVDLEPGALVPTGAKIAVRVRAEFARPCRDPMVGILVRDRLGIDVFGTNTRVEGVALGSYAAGDALEVDFEFPCLLSRQEYSLTVAVQHADGISQDWVDGARSFTVVDDRAAAGLASFPVQISYRALSAGR
jgi:lipopolysaccharide transport system ATP-binding protein